MWLCSWREPREAGPPSVGVQSNRGMQAGCGDAERGGPAEKDWAALPR